MGNHVIGIHVKQGTAVYLIILVAYFKIQALAGNKLKICVGAGFEIISTLISYSTTSLFAPLLA